MIGALRVNKYRSKTKSVSSSVFSEVGKQNTIRAMTWDFQQCGKCDQQRLRPACAYAQSDQSLCSLLEYSMSVKLRTGHRLEFLSLIGGCTGSSESTLVKIPHCWKSHAMAQLSAKHHSYFHKFINFRQYSRT